MEVLVESGYNLCAIVLILHVQCKRCLHSILTPAIPEVSVYTHIHMLKSSTVPSHCVLGNVWVCNQAPSIVWPDCDDEHIPEWVLPQELLYKSVIQVMKLILLPINRIIVECTVHLELTSDQLL